MKISTLELKIPPVVVVVLTIMVMALTKSLFPAFGFPSSIANLFAGFISVTAVAFAILGVFEFRKQQTTLDPRDPEKSSKVVSSGVFGVTRNPMYLAMLLFIAALGIYWQHSGFILFVVACMLYLQRFQIIPEERILAAAFGDEYHHYCKKVARWF